MEKASSSTSRQYHRDLEDAFEKLALSSSVQSDSVEKTFSSTLRQNQRELEFFYKLALSSASISANLSSAIFINHGGSEALATNICQALHVLGLRTFVGVKPSQPGNGIPPEIRAAVASAPLLLAIFSPNHAQYPWCLDELSFMLKTGIKILPIFYKVEPSDLRCIDHGKGVYADAFSEHEKKGRYTPEKLAEWRKALKTISFYSGYAVKENEDEGRLLNNIVNRILRFMKKKSFDLGKRLVGLDELAQDFERTTLQSAQRQNVKLVGIVGMGGSGKTTLAKKLFISKCSLFDRCSFIFDVRDGTGKNALLDKQKKLLNDLRVNHLPFDNVKEGRRLLANHLRSLRVLIVLDGVDHIDQLDALLPNINSFASGSLVIVTSCELGVLTSWGIFCNFYMPEMNRSHAKQLFSWYAFLQPYPPAGFENLVEGFATACDGSPLSLKVLGEHLCGKIYKDYWQPQLQKIPKILPKKIKATLEVSYDSLGEEEREMFLDVACFFIGEQKNLAIAVWDGSGWSGLSGWETLMNKCLVELDENNRIRMHDHLRDMGREMASIHSPYRLWFPREILNFQKYSQKRMLVRGIIASTSKYPPVPLFNRLERFMGKSRKELFSLGLKILHVQSDQFTEKFASLSEDLVWLRWYQFHQQRNLPSWLSLGNLRVLELSGASDLEELWEDNVEPPLQLRNVTISESTSFQRFPTSIGRLKHLRTIILDEGFCGGSLPEDFCVLQSLEHLELPQSAMLSSLPAGFGDLISLRHIDLSYCSELSMLPVSFKRLTNLQYLNLSACRMLKLRLDMLENITKLEYFNVQYCKKLEELPYHITNQTSLRELYTGHTSLRDVPVNIGQLSKLENFRVGSQLLTSLPASLRNLTSLTTLEIRFCEKLECLPPFMGWLNLLKEVYIIFTGIRELHFGAGSSSSPYKLQNIITDAQASKTSISEECCPNLQTLILAKNHRLIEIGMLPTSVNFLKIEDCKMLKSIRGIGGLVNLQKLIINECPELDELPSFANLASLKEFEIWGCRKVEKIEGLEHSRSRSLQKLHISDCLVLNEISSFADLDSLKFEMQGCSEFEKIEGLEHSRSLQNLRDLKIRSQLLKSLPTSLGNISTLTTLKIHCPRLTSLPTSLGNLSSLTTLKIRCPLLISLPTSLENLFSLTTLKIQCPMLTSLPISLGNLSSLTTLDIDSCAKLECLPKSIGCVRHLKKISLIFGDQKSSLLSLPDEFCLLQSLEHLDLQGCHMLLLLPNHFGDLINLRHIDLSYCSSLRRLPVSLKHLTHLEYLNLTDCTRLSISSDLLENITSPKTFKFFKYTGLKESIQMTRNELNTCGSIQKFLKFIGQLQQLEKVVVDGCVNTSLKALPEEFCHLKALTHLTLHWCRALTSLPTQFGNLKSLQHINIAFCNQLKELPHSFKQLKQLQYLDFQGCSNLRIPPHFLGKITTLHYLNFKNCGKLRVFPTQVPCQLCLRSLNLVGTSLEELPNEIGMLINLEVLEIGSPYLTDLPVSMGNMMNLQTLNVEGCTSLTCLPDSLGLLENLSSIKAPQALKDSVKQILEETAKRRPVIL